MKSIEEAFPECKKEGYGWLRNVPGYTELLASLGPEILVEVWENYYQGSTYVLCKMDGQYGYLSFGWGSCSGCDALQGASSHEDLDDIRQGLFQSISWFNNRQELMESVEKEYEANDSWFGRDEKKKFVADCRKYFEENT